MIRKNWFYLSLIIIYIIFLTKDNIIGLETNINDINKNYNEIINKNTNNDYEKLLKLVNLVDEQTSIVYTKIIRREIYNFYDKIIINKGTKDNIKNGDIVINEHGLVGVISKTQENSSEVELLTNKNTNISVKINDSYGILYCDNKTLKVKNIKLTGKIKEGDEVTTSGLTSIPESIKIGTVKEINKDTLELEYILDIEGISNQDLKYLGVITL